MKIGKGQDREKAEGVFGLRGCHPGVLQKSAEVIDGERVVETLFFEECGRV